MTGVLNSHIQIGHMQISLAGARVFSRGTKWNWGKVKHEGNDNSPQDGSRVQDASYWADMVQAIAQSKDEAAFQNLFNYFAPRVKSFILGSGASESVAEDIAQETLMTLWRKAEQFNPSRASVSTWIFTIARNKKIDRFRKDAKPLPDANDPTYAWVGDDTPENRANQKQYASDLHAALGSMPPDQKQVLTMSFLEELPHKEIADALGVPLGTVKSRIRLGLKRLRTLVDRQHGEDL